MSVASLAKFRDRKLVDGVCGLGDVCDLAAARLGALLHLSSISRACYGVAVMPGVGAADLPRA